MPYIHFTEEQKLRAANVDLEQFLLAQGEELIYRNREIRLRANHSVVIKGNEWFDFAPRKGGGPISFVQTFYGLSYAVNVLFENNTAELGNGTGGGAIYLNAAAAFLRQCTFKGNKAHSGGAIYAFGGNTSQTINGCTVIGMPLLMDSCTFGQGDEERNLADQRGGAIHCHGNALIRNTEIVGQHSNQNGGAIYISSQLGGSGVQGKLLLQNSKVTGNTANGNGAGIYIADGGTLYLYRCPKCKHADFDVVPQYGCGADLPDAVCPVCGTAYEKDGFNIPLETLLGLHGEKVPDIDLNVSGEYQGKAIEHLEGLFGKDHVFRAGTIGTVAFKTAFGYVKRYLEKRGLKVSKAEEERLATGCTGVKRTTGQHPGGMVVIPQDREIYDFCPVQHPADDTDTDIVTTHFDYPSIQPNLLKLDLLGHDDPSMIRMLEDLTGVNTRTDIRLDDPDTMSLFTTSEKLGFVDDRLLGPTGAVALPEFNTHYARQMLVETKPQNFSDLVRLSGVLHGTDAWLHNARELILDGTANIAETVNCRDDILLYLEGQGMERTTAYEIMEAVRKGQVARGGFQKGWMEDMKAHNVPQWYMDSLAKIGYLFPKAHAVAYVMMAYRIAWFKVHRPLAFYAAYFTIRAKAFDAIVMCQGIGQVKRRIQEIDDKGKDALALEEDMLVTLEVCYEFYLRGFRFETIDLYRSDATKFIMDEEKGTLLPPFTSVPGLGESTAQYIVEQRKGRVFHSLSEFTSACPKLSRWHIEGLKAAGALEGLL
mgnify:CR=1 FL=1